MLIAVEGRRSGATSPGDTVRPFDQGQNLVFEGPEGAHHVQLVVPQPLIRRCRPSSSAAGTAVPLLHHGSFVASRCLLSGFRIRARQGLAVKDCGAFSAEQLGDGGMHPLRRGGAPRPLVGYFHETSLFQAWCMCEGVGGQFSRLFSTENRFVDAVVVPPTRRGVESGELFTRELSVS